MSSFSIRDILDLPEDTMQSLQAIKTPAIETITSNECQEDESTQVDAKKTLHDDTKTTDGKHSYVYKNVRICCGSHDSDEML